MQTFLPYESFEQSAKVLDNKRLNKQIVECYQILKAITDSTYGWQSHPIVKMWEGYPTSLLIYAFSMYKERKNRTGKEHQSYINMEDYYYSNNLKYVETISPVWLGNEKFHDSHKSNLLRKDKSYYSQYFPNIQDNLPYLWYNTNNNTWYSI